MSHYLIVEDTAGAPDVHLVRVVSVRYEALWGSVPTCRDLLCVGRELNTLIRAKVPQIQSVLLFRGEDTEYYYCVCVLYCPTTKYCMKLADEGWNV